MMDPKVRAMFHPTPALTFLDTAGSMAVREFLA